MPKKIKISEIFKEKKVVQGNKEITQMSCTNHGIIKREDKFKKKLSKSFSKNKVANKGDFVFGLSRNILNFGMMEDDEGSFSSAYKIYECRYSFNFSKFLELYIRNNHDYFYRCISGGAREGQTISQKVLFDLEVIVPTDDEIDRIVNLNKLFINKINLNVKSSNILEKISHSIYKSWFEDLSFVPSDWKVDYLKNLINIRGGLSYQAKFIGSGKHLVTMGCISPFERFNYNGLKKYSGPFKEQHLLKENDIVLSTRDVTLDRITLGAPAIIPKTLDGSILATNMYKVINEKNISPFFLLEIFRSQKYRKNIVSSSKGSTVLMLTRDDVLNYKILIPTENKLNKFHSIMEKINFKIQCLIDETKSLNNLRDIIIPNLLSNKFKI